MMLNDSKTPSPSPFSRFRDSRSADAPQYTQHSFLRIFAIEQNQVPESVPISGASADKQV
jgi:hypothetical protein